MRFSIFLFSKLDIIALSLPGLNVDISQLCFELDLKVNTSTSNMFLCAEDFFLIHLSSYVAVNCLVAVR